MTDILVRYAEIGLKGKNRAVFEDQLVKNIRLALGANLIQVIKEHKQFIVKAKGLIENKLPAHRGGRIAKHARLELEQKTGKKVVTHRNFLGAGENRKRLH